VTGGRPEGLGPVSTTEGGHGSSQDAARGHGMINNVLAALFIMAWHTTLPYVPIYASSLGATPLIVGLVVAANMVLPLGLALYVGAAADRFGTTRVARWSATLFVVSYLLVIGSRNLGLLALGMSGVGLADVGLVVAVQTYVALTSTAANRDKNFAHLTIWISLGALVGPVLGGFLADQWGFRAAFAGSMVLALIALTVAWLMPELPRSDADTAPLPGAARTLRDGVTLVRDPGVMFVLLTNASMMFAMSVRQSFFPLYLRSVGLSTTLIGTIFSMNSFSQMLIRPLIAAAVTRYHHVGVLGLGLLLTMLGIVVTPWLRSFWPLAAAFAVVGIGNGFIQPLTMSLVSGRATANTRGLAIGLRMTTNQIAQIVGPPFFGIVVGGLGLEAAFYAAAAATATGFATLSRFGRLAAAEHAARAHEADSDLPAAHVVHHKETRHAGTHAESAEGVLGRPGS
jgi:MFS family permease